MSDHLLNATKPVDEMAIISAELSKLAVEIEELPPCDCGNMSNEQIMRLQKIDFCSQRLQDLSSLVVLLSHKLERKENGIAQMMADNARLEYTRELFS